MNCARPACVFATDNDLLKLQRLQNKDFRTIGNFSGSRFAHGFQTSVRI
jgi:hypothetical protein